MFRGRDLTVGLFGAAGLQVLANLKKCQVEKNTTELIKLNHRLLSKICMTFL